MATELGKGIDKTLAIGKQTALGTPKVGAGGFLLRRITSIITAAKATTENNEIASHRQGTGVTYGEKSTSVAINGALSPTTYELMMAGIMRQNFVATPAVSGASITIAGSGPYTITRAAGDWLTDGIKAGDIGRLTAGAFTAINSNNNFYIISLTPTVLTVAVLNGDTLVAEGPIATATFTVTGKKSLAPLTSHTDDFFTIEEWKSTKTSSEVVPNLKVNTMSVSVPATGQATIDFNLIGTGQRTLASSESFTSPTAETSTPVVHGTNGFIYVNNVLKGCVTSASLSFDTSAVASGASIGDSISCDVSTGKIKVSGSFTAQDVDASIQTLYDSETNVSLVLIAAADGTKDAEFVSFSMGRIKITGDTPDDGETVISRTYPFTAELNSAGGAALAWDKTIATIQDSEL